VAPSKLACFARRLEGSVDVLADLSPHR
jgi:hypothetical protein